MPADWQRILNLNRVRIGSGAQNTSWRSWLRVWMRWARAERRATNSTRICSIGPFRVFGITAAAPESAARAAETASVGSDLPTLRRI
jgi:nucleoid-associated protein YgaU